MPETSVIIRAFNEEKHIGDLLAALAAQTYRNFEIIIVDSGSTDRTREIAKQFGTNIIEIESRDFTFGHALNVGCAASRGKYLAFASAHVLPADQSWLRNLVAPLADEGVAMVYGRQMGNARSKFSERMDLARLFGARAASTSAPLHHANNANAAIKKKLWEKRKFDEYLFGLEDIDWARHMTEKGYVVQYEPDAAVYHIHEEQWHQVFNRYRREAIAAVRIGLSEPPQARLATARALCSVLGDFAYSFPNLSLSRIEEIVRFRYYQWKGSNTGWRQGRRANLDRERNEIFRPDENEAVVIRGRRSASLAGMPVPDLRPGDVLIKVDYVGVCRTDLEIYDGTLGYYRDGVAAYPIVPGHEFSGTIAKVGSNSAFQERFAVGQRVVGECILSRGAGSERKEVGVINHNGAYGKFIVMPGDRVHKIPDHMDSKVAALAEPLAVVLRALRRIEPRLAAVRQTAVIGAGPIGNFAAQTLALRGYETHLFDSDRNRLALVPGAAGRTSVVLDGLDRFDLIVEATGSREVLERVLKESARDATIMLLGFPYGDIDYDFEDLVGKEKCVIGSVGADRGDFRDALGLLARLHTAPFTETVLPLAEYERAWRLHRERAHLKILLKP